jgi:hypothetical protein
MPLHLIKLCVGAESIADLEGWIKSRLAAQKRAGKTPEQLHTTRMVPKRAAELLDGGSLYWVIKGQASARQKLLDIRPFIDADGIGRCNLVLEPTVVPVLPQPRKAFQGWRYFDPKDAPPDIGGKGAKVADMPEELRRELASLGLL